MSGRRLPTEIDAASALLAQALASGHYLKTPADEQCPSGVWMLVPLDRRLVGILDLAGEQHADLEDDQRERDVADEEPSLGTNETISQVACWQHRAHAHTADLEDDEICETAGDEEPSDSDQGSEVLPAGWAPDWRPWTFLPDEEVVHSP